MYLGHVKEDTYSSLPRTLAEPSLCHHILFLQDAHLHRQSFYMGPLTSSLLQKLSTKFSVPSLFLRRLLHIALAAYHVLYNANYGDIRCLNLSCHCHLFSLTSKHPTQLGFKHFQSAHLGYKAKPHPPQEIKNTLFFSL